MKESNESPILTSHNIFSVFWHPCVCLLVLSIGPHAHVQIHRSHMSTKTAQRKGRRIYKARQPQATPSSFYPQHGCPIAYTHDGMAVYTPQGFQYPYGPPHHAPSDVTQQHVQEALAYGGYNPHAYYPPPMYQTGPPQQYYPEPPPLPELAEEAVHTSSPPVTEAAPAPPVVEAAPKSPVIEAVPPPPVKDEPSPAASAAEQAILMMRNALAQEMERGVERKIEHAVAPFKTRIEALQKQLRAGAADATEALIAERNKNEENVKVLRSVATELKAAQDKQADREVEYAKELSSELNKQAVAHDAQMTKLRNALRQANEAQKAHDDSKRFAIANVKKLNDDMVKLRRSLASSRTAERDVKAQFAMVQSQFDKFKARANGDAESKVKEARNNMREEQRGIDYKNKQVTDVIKAELEAAKKQLKSRAYKISSLEAKLELAQAEVLKNAEEVVKSTGLADEHVHIYEAVREDAPAKASDGVDAPVVTMRASAHVGTKNGKGKRGRGKGKKKGKKHSTPSTLSAASALAVKTDTDTEESARKQLDLLAKMVHRNAILIVDRTGTTDTASLKRARADGKSFAAAGEKGSAVQTLEVPHRTDGTKAMLVEVTGNNPSRAMASISTARLKTVLDNSITVKEATFSEDTVLVNLTTIDTYASITQLMSAMGLHTMVAQRVVDDALRSVKYDDGVDVENVKRHHRHVMKYPEPPISLEWALNFLQCMWCHVGAMNSINCDTTWKTACIIRRTVLFLLVSNVAYGAFTGGAIVDPMYPLCQMIMARFIERTLAKGEKEADSSPPIFESAEHHALILTSLIVKLLPTELGLSQPVDVDEIGQSAREDLRERLSPLGALCFAPYFSVADMPFVMTTAMQVVTMAVCTDPLRGVNEALNLTAVQSVVSRADSCMRALGEICAVDGTPPAVMASKVNEFVAAMRTGDVESVNMPTMMFGINSTNVGSIMKECTASYMGIKSKHGTTHNLHDPSSITLRHPSMAESLHCIAQESAPRGALPMPFAHVVRTSPVVHPVKVGMTMRLGDEDDVAPLNAVLACLPNMSITMSVCSKCPFDDCIDFSHRKLRALMNPSAVSKVLATTHGSMAEHGGVPYDTQAATREVVNGMIRKFREGYDQRAPRDDGDSDDDEVLLRDVMGSVSYHDGTDDDATVVQEDCTHQDLDALAARGVFDGVEEADAASLFSEDEEGE